MKIFISYSRIDAKETANVIHNYLTEYGHHQVFIDTLNIPYGDEWKKVIQKEISNCDIFVVIVTPSALYRLEVEKEVELAKKLKKKIIPCIAKDYVDENEIKWELNKYQGFFYERDAKLAMDLHKIIKRETRRKTSEVKDEIKSYDHSNDFEEIGQHNRSRHTFFDAEILNKKQAYERGKDTVQFRSQFKGHLTNGFFANLIWTPDDDEFENITDNVSEDRKYVKSWCRETLDYWSDKDKGKLTGDVNTDWKYWNWNIPEFAPLGDYKIEMGVYDSVNNKKPILTSIDTIRVIDKDDSHYRRYNRVSI